MTSYLPARLRRPRSSRSIPSGLTGTASSRATIAPSVVTIPMVNTVKNVSTSHPSLPPDGGWNKLENTVADGDRHRPGLLHVDAQPRRPRGRYRDRMPLLA